MSYQNNPRRTVLVWHVHGSWMDSFTAGNHHYLVPVNNARDADGRGLCGRNWPQADEIPVDRLRNEDVDVVVLQRPQELELATRWLGRRLGLDVPAVYVEHNTPRPSAVDSAHPVSTRSDILLVHVTDFNRLMWESGLAPTTVIPHGIADPGHLYGGDVAAVATMINEPLRRWRTVGTDLLARLATAAPIDVWGIATEELNQPPHGVAGVVGHGDLPGARVLAEVAQRRVYVHTARWTSLGLSLVQAMFIGMPIVAVGATMVPLVIPGEAGVVSADVDTLVHALMGFVTDRGAAEVAGKAAREFAMAHFGIDRFLHQWDDVIEAQCA